MMKSKFAILAMTSLVLVAGCNRAATNSSASNNSRTTNAAASTAPAAPGAGAGAAVDQAFVEGHWSPAPDCSSTMSFNPDGTAEATGETEPARWTFENGAVLAGPTGKPAVRTPVSRSGDKLVLAGPQGQTITLNRCPSAATGAPADGADGGEATEAEEGSQ